MATIGVLRHQHDEILGVVADITQRMEQGFAGKEAVVVLLLKKLSAHLSAHLAMEDHGLYPELLQHDDPKVRETAGDFIEEMGGLKDAFVVYRDRWTDLRALIADPDRFVDETRALFVVLGHRIDREDNELYVLVESNEVGS